MVMCSLEPLAIAFSKSLDRSYDPQNLGAFKLFWPTWRVWYLRAPLGIL